MGILATADFVVRYTYHTTKVKITGQLFFGRYKILPINHVAGWIYIYQRKQAQIDIDAIHENSTRIDHDYLVVDQVMTRTKLVYKYETPFKGPYGIVQEWINITVTLLMGAVTKRVNIRNIRPYKNLIV